MSDQLLPKLGADGQLVEGIVTTMNPDGTVNIAPMGPIVDQAISQFVFRPFRTSTTYRNLKLTGEGIFHITDNVELFAQAALGQPNPLPALEGLILTDACRWYAFRVQSLDDQSERTEIVATTVDSGRERDFLGFNRAKHAVIEAAILATRIHLIPAEELLAEFERLKSPVDKTASRAEQRAFQLLQDYVQTHLDSSKQEVTR